MTEPLTIEKIKRLLSEITQGKWYADKCDGVPFRVLNGKNGKVICHEIDDMNSDNCIQNHYDCAFIAASPSIVKFLLDRVEELEIDKDAAWRAFEGHTTAWKKENDQLQKERDAYREVAILLRASEGITVKKSGGTFEGDWVDAEAKRIMKQDQCLVCKGKHEGLSCPEMKIT